MIPRRQTVESSYTYRLPASIVQQINGNRHYRLAIFKQAGTPAEPVNIVVALPAGAELVTAVPTPTEINGPNLHFALILETNTYITIEYR